MILVDANVFLIDLRYQRDRAFAENRAFLDRLGVVGDGAVTLYNLLEVAGVLSFNLNPLQLKELMVHFPRRYRVAVVPPMDPRAQLPGASVGEILARMESRCALGDAVTMTVAERCATPGSCFVTWDADHFAGRTSLAVLTPPQWLATGGKA